MSEAVVPGEDVPAALRRWLDEGDAVVWAGRARPALMRWPPRSVWLLFLAAGATFAAGVSSLAWSEVTADQPVAAGWAPCLITAGGMWMAALFLLGLLDPRGRYALVRTRAGALVGLTWGPTSAIRFELPPGGCDPIALERGDVEWGELEVALLPNHRPARMLVRWPDVVVDDRLAALVMPR